MPLPDHFWEEEAAAPPDPADPNDLSCYLGRAFLREATNLDQSSYSYLDRTTDLKQAKEWFDENGSIEIEISFRDDAQGRMLSGSRRTTNVTALEWLPHSRNILRMTILGLDYWDLVPRGLG